MRHFSLDITADRGLTKESAVDCSTVQTESIYITLYFAY